MAVEDTDYIGGLDPDEPDGSSPKSEGDDHLRLLKDVLQHCFAGFAGEVLLAGSEAQGATANDYVLTISPAPAAYKANTVVIFKANHANTGAATLKINALSAVAIQNPEGTDLRANAITNGCWVMATCDGTNYRLLAGNSQAIYDYVDQAQFQSALPSQASNAGKYLKTDGTDASWQAALQQVATAPGSDIGAVYLPGTGVMEWNGTAYAQVYTKTSIGLGNVNNTSDAAKPISTATQTALNAKANLSGATFTGPITSTSLVSTGAVFSGNGGGQLTTTGDVAGSPWGGLLSSYIATQLSLKQAAGSYAGRSYGGTLSFGWNGAALTGNVDGVGVGALWTSANFDPSTKQNTGPYVQYGHGNQITLDWTGSAVSVFVNGTSVGTLTPV